MSGIKNSVIITPNLEVIYLNHPGRLQVSCENLQMKRFCFTPIHPDDRGLVWETTHDGGHHVRINTGNL